LTRCAVRRTGRLREAWCCGLDRIVAEGTSPHLSSLVVSLWIRGDDIGAFEAFEQAAAAVMSKHGGRIETVIRCSDFEAGPFEVHIVTFPDVKALDAYRQDPRVAELRPFRERVISRTEIWSGEQRHPYGPGAPDCVQE
jgi:hypothetical protein